MKTGEESKAMQQLLDSDGWKLVVRPLYQQKRDSLVGQLLCVDNMKDFREVKHAVHALDNLVSLVEMMGNPKWEPELEDTSLRPSEGIEK